MAALHVHPHLHGHEVAALLDPLGLEVELAEGILHAREEPGHLLRPAADAAVVEPDPGGVHLDLRVADLEQRTHALGGLARVVDAPEEGRQVCHGGRVCDFSAPSVKGLSQAARSLRVRRYCGRPPWT